MLMAKGVHRETLMMLKEADVEKIRKKKKIHRIITLAILLLACGGIWYYAYKTILDYNSETQEKLGSMNVVMCHACGLQEIRRITDISEAKCSKCQESAGYAMKCSKCGREFPFSAPSVGDKDKKEYLDVLEKMQLCPKCGSNKVNQISVKNFIGTRKKADSASAQDTGEKKSDTAEKKAEAAAGKKDSK